MATDPQRIELVEIALGNGIREPGRQWHRGALVVQYFVRTIEKRQQLVANRRKFKFL